MNNSIHKVRGFFESEQGVALVVTLIIILVGTGSYALGKISERERSCVEIKTGESAVLNSNTRATGQTASVIQSTAQKSLTSTSTQNYDTRIVASKSGTRYYYAWCSGLSRIKEENRVYFSSTEQAEAKGLTLAKNCN